MTKNTKDHPPTIEKVVFFIYTKNIQIREDLIWIFSELCLMN